LQLVNHLDLLKYPVNDVAFHPTETLLVIGTGSYDGGAFYEGELLRWNFKSSTLESLLEDNREVVGCRFTDEGNKLQFTLHPSDDLYGETPYTITTYEVAFPVSPGLAIDTLQPVAEIPFATAFDPVAAREKMESVVGLLRTLAEQKGQVFENRSLVWDLQFLDEHTLCAAGSNATIELHDLSTTGEKNAITFPAPGDCVELFVGSTKETVYVNLWHSTWEDPDRTRMYRVDVRTRQYQEVFVGQHTFSKTSDDYFLARHVDFEDQKQPDLVFDQNFETVFQKPLGHFDLFNHYLRIDHTGLLYFLKGKPASQHKNKVLCSVDPGSFAITEVFPLEKSPDHYNDLTGIHTREHLIVGGKVYFSRRSAYDTYEIRAIELAAKAEKWYKTYTDKVTSFGTLNDGNTLIAAFASGAVELMDVETGKTLTRFTTQLPDSFPKPLSVATMHDKVAIGFTDGRILIIRVPQA
jgi:WD40 repeat protein